MKAVQTEQQKKRQLILFLALDVLWIGFIFCRSLQTADRSMAESGRILALVRKILPFMTSFLIRKLGHFTEFLILGALFCLTGRSVRRLRDGNAFHLGFLYPALAGLLVAAGDESIQLGVEGRSGEIRDVLIDFSGVLCALLLGLLLEARRRKKAAPPKSG
ncbi:MAG: VanZ family protein [Lachnospiraceae bacterium]|nr:VanZ family protein [Lachnospiraceae bacterium]